jgi:hypothetical protein
MLQEGRQPESFRDVVNGAAGEMCRTRLRSWQ